MSHCERCGEGKDNPSKWDALWRICYVCGYGRRCYYCKKWIDDDLTAKYRVMDEMFGMEPSNYTCGRCWRCTVSHVWHALWCKTCWEYHNWSDFKRWISGTQNKAFELPTKEEL